MKLIRTLCVFSLFVWTGSLFGQAPKYSNEFLNIGVGAKAHGLSGAMVATVDDVSAGYWNPAGLTGLFGEGDAPDIPLQISAMHAEWFAGIAQYDYLAFAKSINKERQSTLALSLVRFGIDQIPNTLNLVGSDGSVNYDNVTEFSAADYGFLISYGQRLKNPYWKVGASTKIIRRVIGTFGHAWGFGVDVGAQFKRDNWSFGIVGKDITTTYNAWQFNLSEEEKQVFRKTGNDIPVSSVEITLPRIITGAAYKFNFAKKYSIQTELNLDFTFDGQRNTLISSEQISVDPHLGLELGYSDFLYLRGGLGNIQQATDDIDGSTTITSVQPNFGIGIRLGRITIDYALTDIGNSSQVLYSNIFSLRINLQNRKTVKFE